MAVVAIAMLAPMQLDAAHADSFNPAKYKKKITVYKDYIPVEVQMGSKIKGAKKVTVTSSKSTVAKVNKEAAKYKMVVFTAKKKGKAKLTIKIKKSSGTKTYRTTVKVVGYSSPAKSVKIAKQSFTKKFKAKNSSPTRKAKKLSEKVRVKCKSGWKVKIYQRWITNSGDIHYKVVKNFTKIKYKKNPMFQWIEFKFYKKSANYTIIKSIDINTNAL